VGFRNSSGTFSVSGSGYYGRARVTDPAFGGGATTIQTQDRWFADGVVNWKPSEKVLVGAEALYGNQKFSSQTGLTGRDQWWGVAGYGKIQITDKVSIAGRGEYLRDSDGYLFDNVHASFDPSRSTLGAPNAHVEVWEFTGTLNFDVWKNMLLRFEGRYDQATTHGVGPAKGTTGPAPFAPHNDQITISVDAVYSF
jgi:hypothetical protein